MALNSSWRSQLCQDKIRVFAGMCHDRTELAGANPHLL